MNESSPAGFRERLRLNVAPVVPLTRYLLLTTETHAFCAALAFFALVAFYPVSSMLLAWARYALRFERAHEVVVLALKEYYPEAQDFLLRNLEVSVKLHGDEVFRHAFWILLGAAGVFIPLETAFNRLWGFTVHRPYWRNQLMGLLLTAASSVLAVVFVLLTAGVHAVLAKVALPPLAAEIARSLSLRMTALAFSVTAFALFYRYLPNGRVRTADVVPAAVLAGLAAEAVRLLYVLALPLLDLRRTQGPYFVSISFVLLAYFEAFVLLGGAYIAAGRRAVTGPGPEPASR
jgi:uncharacterized BrkB/YihY/UPF0761 family membrane protein